jgi:hypothetical protein
VSSQGILIGVGRRVPRVVCVAVTRGGFGDVWLFKDRTAAYLHPLVQYGDALLSRPSDVTDEYNDLEWNNLRDMVGLPEWYPQDTMTRRQVREDRETQAHGILEALVRRAQDAPTDAAEICRRVTEDRRLGTIMAKQKANAPQDTPAATEEKAPRGGLPPAVRGPKGVPLDAVIRFGADKAGVSYGADNNPKKVGSKTYGRFAMYADGITIQQCLDAGITTADLNYDREHGFVSFEGGTVVVDAPAVAEEQSPAPPAHEGHHGHHAAAE